MRNSYIIGFCVFIVVMFLLAFFCLYKAFYVEQETVAGKDSVVRHFVIKDTVVVKQAIYQKRQNVKPRCISRIHGIGRIEKHLNVRNIQSVNVVVVTIPKL